MFMDEETATATTDSQDAPDTQDSEYHRRVVKQITRRFDMSLKAQGPRRRQWRRNEEMINGDHFAIFTNHDPNKSKVWMNLCHEVVETIMPILTDILPKPDVIPDPATIENINLKAMMDTAQKIEDGVYHQWRGAEMTEEWPMVAKSALIYGNGPVRMLPGDGKFMDIEPVPIFGWFLAPNAISVKKSSWIMTAAPTYLSDLRRTYGDDAKGIKPQGRLDAFLCFHLFPEKNRDGGGETMSGTAAESATMTDLVGTDEEAGQNDLDQVLLIDAWLDHEVNYDDDAYISEEGGEVPEPRKTYRHITIAGDRVLVDEETDYKIGDPPFTQIINYPQPNSPWGKGESEQIEMLNLAADVILSEAVDATIMAGNPPLKITKDVRNENPGGVKIGPREEVVVPNRLSLVEWMEHKGLPPEMTRLPLMFLELINTVSGVTDVTQGNKPGQVTAGYAIKALQGAAQGRIRFKEKSSLRGPLVDIYRHIMRHIKENLDKPVVFIKRDRMNGDFRPAEYGAEDFKDQDFIIRAGVPITENAAEMMDLIVQIAPLAGLTPEEFVELLPSEIRDVIQSVRNRSQGKGPLQGIDPSLLTEGEKEILQGDDEDAIAELLYSLQQRGIYSPPAQDFQSGMAPGGPTGSPQAGQPSTG